MWSLLYRRRDQDAARYTAYLKAEEELEAEFYQNSCYYLDNVCVDFRYQRQGLGRLMIEWGLEEAKKRGLDIMTEAGEMGLGLYMKLGFQQIGTWVLPGVSGDSEALELRVLRYSV
jgi:GNAT superfamily N-acetyltransferase